MLMKNKKLIFGSTIAIAGLAGVSLRLARSADLPFKAYVDMVDHYQMTSPGLLGGEARVDHKSSVMWDKTDDRFLKARDMVDSAITPNMAPAAIDNIYQQFAAIAKQQPHNPLAFFGWGWATYYQMKYEAVYPGHSNEAVAVLNGIPLPHDYEYDRLLFCLQEYIAPTYPYKSLGEQLLAHNPHDILVRYWLISALDYRKPDARRSHEVS